MRGGNQAWLQLCVAEHARAPTPLQIPPTKPLLCGDPVCLFNICPAKVPRDDGEPYDPGLRGLVVIAVETSWPANCGRQKLALSGL